MPEYRQQRYAAPPGSTDILLVRHGASEPAVEGRPFALVAGQGDPALAPEGQVQAAQVCARLLGAGIDAVYVTTLRRTVETAAELVRGLGIEAVVEPDLREVSVGEWEGGLLRMKVAARDPMALRMYEQQRWDVIPGAEPAEAFAHRVRGAILRIAAAHRDQRVAVFSHGGTIGEVLAQATGSQPFAFIGAENGSISRLVVADQRWIVRGFNDTAHLDGIV